MHAIVAAAVAATLSLLSLLGWLMDVPQLTSIVESASTFKPNTALATLAASASLALHGMTLRWAPSSPTWQRAARALACVPLLLGSLVLMEYAFDVELGFDQLLVMDSWTDRALHPGRPTVFSAAALVFLGLVLLLARSKHKTTLKLSAAGAAVLSWAALVVLAYGLTFPSVELRIRPISLPAAISLLSLTYGAVWLMPRSGIAGVLLSDTVAGLSVRRLLPLATLLPIALGWLHLLGARRGWFSSEVGLSLLTASVVGGYLLLGGLHAVRIFTLETARDQAYAAPQQALHRMEHTQSALQELTKRLQLATRAARIGIWDWDLTTQTIVWDEQMHELYGLPQGSFSGAYAEWRSYLFPEDALALEQAVHAALPAGSELSVEFRIRRFDGSVRRMQGRSALLRDPSGKVTRILGADTDITAQRDAESRLQASEQRFRAVFDSATQLMGLVRLDGTLIEANQTALQFAATSSSEVIGRPFWETPWWTDLPEGQQELRNAIAQAAGGQYVRYRTLHRRWNRLLASVDFSLKPLFDAQGKVHQLLAEGRDVTEAEEARAALEQSETRFRNAMEYAAIGVALVGLDGRFLKVNRALCELVGYSEDELIALTFQDITHPDDLQADLSLAQDLLAGKISHYHLEKRYVHKRGHIVWILLSGSLVRDSDGKPLMFIAEIQDITEQKASEARLRASLAEKEVLLREIHHRVKNNLQIISSILRLQADQSDEPRLRGMFEDSQARIQAMALIHDGLYQSASLSSIEFGSHLQKLALMLTEFQSRPDCRVRLESKLQQVNLDLDVAIPLGLISNELITNVLKHAFPGRSEGTLYVELYRSEADATLTIAVGDDGVGLPSNIDIESSKSLGLRLIRALTRQLRGELTISRAEHTKISITIPLPAAG